VHGDDNKPAPSRAGTGPCCVICHRRGAKRARVRVEIADKVTADERLDLCPECAGDRYRVIEAVRRIG